MHTVKKGEKRAGRGLPLEPEVPDEHSVEFEPVAAARDNRALVHVKAAVVPALSVEIDAIAHLEAFRIGERHLLLVPVRVGRQPRLDRRFFDEDRIQAAADDTHMRAHEYGIAHTVRPGKYPDGPPA